MEEILNFSWGKLITLAGIVVGCIGIFVRYIDARFKGLTGWLRASEEASLSFRENMDRQVEHIGSTVNDLRGDVGNLAHALGQLQGEQSSLMRQSDCRKLHDVMQERVAKLEQDQSLMTVKLLTAKCVSERENR